MLRSTITCSKRYRCFKAIKNLPKFSIGGSKYEPSSTYHDDCTVYGHRKSNSSRNYKVPPEILENRVKNINLYNLVTAYRKYGHQRAELDPLGLSETTELFDELDPSYHGLSANDGCHYDLRGILNWGQQQSDLNNIISVLRSTYCGTINAEFLHIDDQEEREWFAEQYEHMINNVLLSNEDKVNLAIEMMKSQIFDHFLAAKFSTVKRYGGEGAESMMGFFMKVFQVSAEENIEQVVMCMPHRGRLNLLTMMLNYPPVNMFRKMKGLCEFSENAITTGDVLSHLTSSTDLKFNGKTLHVTLIPNPSHLEAANPVAVGKTRGKQMMLIDGLYSDDPTRLQGDKVLCLQVHGDAAFEAQGVVMETLAQANVPHFTVGGSVHLIVNNQLGFTTPASRGRSSLHCSDLAKMIGAPIIHVNGDHPELIIVAAALAMQYRQRFRKDVFVDLVCFRRWGHNEMDDPTFTNPKMYEKIHSRESVPDRYAKKLVAEGILSEEELSKIVNTQMKFLSDDFSKIESYKPQVTHFLGSWSQMVQPFETLTTWDTGISEDLLRYIGAQSVKIPASFNVHPHLQKTHMANRLTKLKEGSNIDWSTAEALAIGSLLYQGFNVRISGQDVGRGTFSHRHAMLVDQTSEDLYIPLNSIVPDQKGHFEVANCILSEEAVLGFEYGMSIEHPNNLMIWEAQFGDFYNGAQIIIDVFVTSGETKWLLQSGLVMLLPHGYDGAGPDHSSCHMERFLQMTDSKENGIDGDEVNIQIANPTTPAQYFHLLRRQMIRNFRKPLIVVAPKTLLRLPAATSSLADMTNGTSFLPVLGDAKVDPNNVDQVIICSGKHYYALEKHRESTGAKTTAIIRVESLCPFPAGELQSELKKFSKAKRHVWSQEEHQNMGPWSFIAPRFENLVGYKLDYSGRKPLAAAAVGIGQLHQAEVQHVIADPFTVLRQ